MSSISTELSQVVAARAHNRCQYCQSQQRLMGVLLTVDHIIPQALGGTHEPDNLCLACWDCNLIKGDRIAALDSQTGATVRLFHPNRQEWIEHFQWSEDSLYIIGLTPIGRATIIALKLNRPPLVESRRYWVKAGWHPPQNE